jgi:hypothetical protein
MLASGDGVFAAGELRHIWERGFTENQLCSCGRPFQECPFWVEVVKRAFGDEAVDGERVAAVGRELVRRRHLPKLLAPPIRTPRFKRLLTSYTNMLQPLYDAIGVVSGCLTIVDSSKDPAYAAILRNLTGFETAVTHLVRDSRAVAYSWQRRRRRPEVVNREAYMVQIRPLGTALAWDLRNLACETVGRGGTSYTMVRYEDLMAAPQQVLGRILSGVQFAIGSPVGERAGIALPEMYHTVSGNPIRMKPILELRPDVEWASEMEPRGRLTVTLLTLPLLLRYRYRINTGVP